jgi:exopolysaccharide biosynthesis polyprenyl glycosylphosphotransferase
MAGKLLKKGNPIPMWKSACLFPDRRRLLLAAGDGFILLLSLIAALMLFRPTFAQDMLRAKSPLILLGGSCLSFSLLALYVAAGSEKGSQRLPVVSPVFFLVSLAILLLSSCLSHLLNVCQPVTMPMLLFIFLSVTLSAGWHWLAGAMPLMKKRGVLFIGEDPLIQELIEITRQAYPHTGEIVSPWSNNKLIEVNDEFVQKLNQLKVKHIIYSVQSGNLPSIAGKLLEARLKRFSLYDGVAYYQKLTGALPIYYLDYQNLLALSQKKFFSTRLAALVKRATDIFLTLLLLPLAFPLLCICALAIKLDSRGPILFIQERLGLGGKPFKILKLRTMIVNAEKNVPQWCKDDDPRITRVGKILRKLRLDEVPQLLNVLKNDMSLVGPRPIRQHFTDLLAKEVPFYRLRLLAKPGLTGWAQVHAGHANTVANHAKMLQYDLFYLINQSFWLDFVILCKTIRTVLLGKGR